MVQLGIAGVGDGVMIGAGGSAVVFAACTDDGVPVAVKLLRISAADERSRKQFEREVAAIERLSDHELIVPVLDSGTSERGEPYLLMPLMAGSVQQALDDNGPLSWEQALELLLLVCDAIEFAHSKDVIHRDIKPANILLDGDGGPLVADFGIAKLVDGTQTMSSQVAATPSFAAPERFRGEPASRQSDVYSLAATYVALVTGQPPYGAKTSQTPEAVMRRVLDEPPVNLSTAGLDVPLVIADVIEKAMSKQPTERPASAGEFARVLKQAAAVGRYDTTGVFAMGLPSNLTTTLLPVAVDSLSPHSPQTGVAADLMKLNETDSPPSSQWKTVLALVVVIALAAVAWSMLRSNDTQDTPAVASGPTPERSTSTEGQIPATSTAIPEGDRSETSPAPSTATAQTRRTEPSGGEDAPPKATELATEAMVPLALTGSSIGDITLSVDRPHLAVEAATAAFGVAPQIDNFGNDPLYQTDLGTWRGEGFSFNLFRLGASVQWQLDFDQTRYGDDWPVTPIGAPVTVEHLLDDVIEFQPGALIASYPEGSDGLTSVCSFDALNVCIEYDAATDEILQIRSEGRLPRMSFWTSSLDGVNIRDTPTLDASSQVLGQIDTGDEAIMISGTYIAEENRFEWCQVLVDLDTAPIGELTVGWVFAELLNDCTFDL